MLSDSVRLDVLGPILAWRGTQPVSLGQVQQRAVLGVLALHANRPIGRDVLIGAVWGEAAPAYAVNLLQKHVSGLRRVLDPVRSARDPAQLLSLTDVGYLLTLPDGSLDLDRFDREVARARRARADGDLAAAGRSLHAALALWRGPAMDGLSGPMLGAARERLTERRISTLEERIDLDLALGQSDELVEELRELIAENPLRERLRGLLMRALHQAGRSAEALASFRDVRRELHAELAIEPGAELQKLHQQILNSQRRDMTGAAALPTAAASTPGGSTPRPAQLPHGLPHFVGREPELRRLSDLLGADQNLMIAAVTGTAGVGKTSLAVRWAHQFSERFPDGRLYANLHGFDPHGEPTEPGDVLRRFLSALGVPPRQIATTVEEQATQYRSLLADRRVLVVLDNARDSDQVSPLLPGTPGCAVVVTSRSRLSGLVAAGAVPVRLTLLTADEATRLLAHRLGTERVDAEPASTADVVEACARLPLALAIVAARVAPHPQYRLSALAAELREARGGLDAFIGETASSDARTVLSWSYHQLSEAAARLFWLLGLHPGPEITLPAAASLIGLPTRQVRRLLAELSGSHLLEEHTPGRFSFHDLLRAYATEQAHELGAAADRHAARGRLLDHLLHSAHAADRTLYPYRQPTEVGRPDPAAIVIEFADQDQALSWFKAERSVLTSAIARAAENDFRAHTIWLTWTISAFLNYDGKWHDWARCVHTALTACRDQGDRAGEAFGHRLLNIAYLQLGQIDEAYAHGQQALELFGELGDRAEHARLHMELCHVLERRGDFDRALEQARRATSLFREVKDRAGEAQALGWVGYFHSRLGHHAQALRWCHRSLALHRQSGDHPSAANTWDALGFAHHELGHYARARDSYEHALALWRGLGDRYETAETLTRLGDTLMAGGAAAEARRRWGQAKEILDDLGHPDAVRLRARLDPDASVVH